MNIAEQLAKLRARRADCVTNMESLVKGAEAENRTFTDDEGRSFDSFRAEVDQIDAHIRRLEAAERATAATARVVDAPAAPGLPSPAAQERALPRVTHIERKREKGTQFARFAMALIASRGQLMQAAEIAKTHFSDTPQIEGVFRAAVSAGGIGALMQRAAVPAGTTTETNWASPLVYYNNIASEFIELLQPMTILGRIAGFRRVPFNVRMPRQTAGSTAAWVGEGTPKPVSKLQFDYVTIPHTKMAVIVAITEELARFSDPSAELVVRDDLLATIAAYKDAQFIDPSVTASAGVRPAAVTQGVTPISVSATTVAGITGGVQAALAAMLAAKIALRAPVWIMDAGTYLTLWMMRTSQDVFAFRDEMQAGRFMGMPYVQSQSVPVDTSPVDPAPDEGRLILVEASEVFVAEDASITVDVSREASLAMDSAEPTQLTSLWQNNLVGLRAEQYCYWLKRRAEAVQMIDGIDITPPIA